MSSFVDSGVGGQQFEFKAISFEEISDFWRETNHFRGSDSVSKVYVRHLGPYLSEFEKPPFQSFAFADGEEIVAATQLVNWNKSWVRYRTIHVRQQYRGAGLGHELLRLAHQNYWPNKHVFGWVRRTHLDWSLKHGFERLTEAWYDDHTPMLKIASRFQVR
ncbi:MAG: hypothetical protein HRT45_03055 [Bdellovibrionales bacterium]|nr:hypothetical protein [Bdellovibrionales bacterium]